MARTIQEIKQNMTSVFVQNAVVSELYGLDSSKTFDEQFSKASLENILFYVVSFGIHTLEKIFDTHKSEVETYIDEMKPHTLRWYVNKSLAFRAGQSLIPDTDEYSNENLTEDEIDTMQVVKYAAAVETAAVVYIKIAGKDLTPISPDNQAGFEAYIKEVKDAGVAIRIINQDADHYRATLRVWYSPMKLNSKGADIAAGGEPVREAVENFIASLPFNGEYRNDRLVDAVQAIDGVVIAELVKAETSINGAVWNDVVGFSVPEAGYYKIYQPADLIIEYIAYESVSN